MSERRIQAARIASFLLVFLVSVVLGGLFFIYTHYSQNGRLPSWRSQGYAFLSASFLTGITGIVIYLLDKLLDRFIGWQKNFIARFVSGLTANILFSIVFLSLTAGYFFRIRGEVFATLVILFVISIFIYEIFYGLFYSYRYYAVFQAQKLRSDRWQLELQFESLKSQISPHYLFNCLNTVSSLLYKDSGLAEEFIRRMADTFRYVLNHQKRKLVSLREELDFVKAYYFLLQVRYEYHLQMEINLPPPALDTLIPPMTLQLLVENAVKHNRISREEPLNISIGFRENRILIENNRTTPARPASGLKVGLENIHQRYRFFTNEKITVTTDQKFEVRLPLIHNHPAAA